jgi:hypothetical protein
VKCSISGYVREYCLQQTTQQSYMKQTMLSVCDRLIIMRFSFTSGCFRLTAPNILMPYLIRNTAHVQLRVGGFELQCRVLGTSCRQPNKLPLSKGTHPDCNWVICGRRHSYSSAGNCISVYLSLKLQKVGENLMQLSSTLVTMIS